MDPRDNPYTPNAGARPPALAGREDELEALEVLLTRLARGRADQSTIVTGLRGVGSADSGTLPASAARGAPAGKRPASHTSP